MTHLACAQVSFEMSEYTADADGMGVLRLLNAIRSAGLVDKTRFYQVRRRSARTAASSRMRARPHASVPPRTARPPRRLPS